MHVRCHDWRNHGHDRDPYYNGVVLHVVMWNDGSQTSLLQSGGKVPVMPLSSCLAGPLEQLEHVLERSPPPRQPCYGAAQRHGRAALDRLLDEAGDKRFRLKVEGFKTRIAAHGPEEALYAGLMRALGYSKNKKPFERLARLLPQSALRPFLDGGSVLSVQALMLGTAGLLPSQRGGSAAGGRLTVPDDPEVDRLQRAWNEIGATDRMSVLEWRFFRVRPENFPTRRIAAAGCLMSGGRGGLLAEGVRLVGGSPGQAQTGLERSLMVRASGYWAGHYDFGMETRWSPRLIGQGRARDIIVNAVLPLVCAWAEGTSQTVLGKRAQLLYGRHPKLDDNWVTRYMERQVFGDGETGVCSARRQQGLLHIYKLFCARRMCRHCPLT